MANQGVAHRSVSFAAQNDAHLNVRVWLSMSRRRSLRVKLHPHLQNAKSLDQPGSPLVLETLPDEPAAKTAR